MFLGILFAVLTDSAPHAPHAVLTDSAPHTPHAALTNNAPHAALRDSAPYVPHVPHAVLTDSAPHAPPPLAVPPAGQDFRDPVFGSRIIRVTDARHGQHCVHAYSYWSAFNSDNTRLLVSCDGAIRLFGFDPKRGRVLPVHNLAGPSIQFEGATWSRTHPDRLFALDKRGSRLLQINVRSHGHRVLRDWRLGKKRAAQLSVSDDETVFSFHLRDGDGQRSSPMVWDRRTDRTYVLTELPLRLDETLVDRCGRQVIVRYSDASFTLWDFRHARTEWFSRIDDNTGGHYDAGCRFIANSDGFHTGIVIRGWNEPRKPRNLLSYPLPGGEHTWNWRLGEHISLGAKDERFALVSTYGGDGSFTPFEDEIILVHTSGAGFVRLAHTRSREANADLGWRYYAQPRAVVDRQGRYVVFTSDLGSRDRLDVLILEIPEGVR